MLTAMPERWRAPRRTVKVGLRKRSGGAHNFRSESIVDSHSLKFVNICNCSCVLVAVVISFVYVREASQLGSREQGAPSTSRVCEAASKVAFVCPRPAWMLESGELARLTE